MNNWAHAIAGRIADEWANNEEFPQDADIIADVLTRLLTLHPEECQRLIGTGVIEEDYFEKLT